jgi:hypothetical protein
MMVVLFPAEGIRDNIFLSRMIMNVQLLIFDQLQPSSLPDIQICLSEQIFKALVIYIDVH